MAGQATKRVIAKNAATLKMIRLGFLASNATHLTPYIFKTIPRKYLFFYAITEALAILLWLQLERFGSPNSAIDINSNTGFIPYFFDIIYVTWFVHGATFVWRGFWWCYLVIPLYLAYRIFTVIFPFLSNFFPSPSGMNHQDGVSTESKRQQKLQKRAERHGGSTTTQRRVK